jgi:recombination protein RecA
MGPRRASEGGVIEKSGAYCTFKGDRIGQGRENACHWVQENPKAAQEIRTLLVERRKAQNAAPASGSASNAAPGAAAA